MSTSRALRGVPARLVAVASGLLLLALPLGASQAQAEHRPGRATVPGKTFAAYEYGWYPISFVDHFDGPLPSHWAVDGTEDGGTVGTRYGMFTIYSGQQGTTGATLTDNAHATGRWEIRLRGRRFERGFTDYTVTAKLVPVGDQHCGGTDVALASYRPTGRRAHFYDRTLPDSSFNARTPRIDLSNNYWHTWAVEVTPSRLSWFVDGHVQRTETRPAALSGVPLTLRLELTAVPGQQMNRSRLQVDTVRYFTLKSPNKLPVDAPPLNLGTYDGAC